MLEYLAGKLLKRKFMHKIKMKVYNKDNAASDISGVEERGELLAKEEYGINNVKNINNMIAMSDKNANNIMNVLKEKEYMSINNDQDNQEIVNQGNQDNKSFKNNDNNKENIKNEENLNKAGKETNKIDKEKPQENIRYFSEDVQFTYKNDDNIENNNEKNIMISESDIVLREK